MEYVLYFLLILERLSDSNHVLCITGLISSPTAAAIADDVERKQFQAMRMDPAEPAVAAHLQPCLLRST